MQNRRAAANYGAVMVETGVDSSDRVELVQIDRQSPKEHRATASHSRATSKSSLKRASMRPCLVAS